MRVDAKSYRLGVVIRSPSIFKGTLVILYLIIAFKGVRLKFGAHGAHNEAWKGLVTLFG